MVSPDIHTYDESLEVELLPHFFLFNKVCFAGDLFPHAKIMTVSLLSVTCTVSYHVKKIGGPITCQASTD